MLSFVFVVFFVKYDYSMVRSSIHLLYIRMVVYRLQLTTSSDIGIYKSGKLQGKLYRE